MDDKDLKWQLEVQTNHMHRLAHKPSSEITAADLVDVAISCKVLLLELRKRGIDV